METGEGIEPKERIIHNDDAWLGGVFEAGGSLGFSPGHKGRYYHPYIAYGDNDEERISFISQLLQATYRQVGNHWILKASGKRVPGIVQDMAPFMPRRKKITEAFSSWEGASTSVKATIGSSVLAADRNEVTQDDYEELIQDSDFLSGVIDGRGVWTSYKKRDANYPLLVVTTTNKVLLEALAAEYGGKIMPARHDQKKNPTENIKSYVWRLMEMHNVERVMKKTANHLRFPEKVKLQGPFIVYE